METAAISSSKNNSTTSPEVKVKNLTYTGKYADEQSALHVWCGGHSKLTEDQIKRICDVLGNDLGRLDSSMAKKAIKTGKVSKEGMMKLRLSASVNGKATFSLSVYRAMHLANEVALLGVNIKEFTPGKELLEWASKE